VPFFVSPMRACQVWLGSVAREESRGEKTPVALLDALCRRWLPQDEQQCGRARQSANRARPHEFFYWFRPPEEDVRRSSTRSQERQTQLWGSLAVLLRARRPKTTMAVDRSFISRVWFHAPEIRAGGGRARKNPTPRPSSTAKFYRHLADLTNSGPDTQAFIT